MPRLRVAAARRIRRPAAMGIGENSHIAFNDPPYADFDDPVWVKVVKLEERSRQQQVGEGHFPNLAAVPTRAITLTIPALLSAKRILCIVPETRKAEAVERSLLGPITKDCPASILRQAGQRIAARPGVRGTTEERVEMTAQPLKSPAPLTAS